jgi:hypothetical protein
LIEPQLYMNNILMVPYKIAFFFVYLKSKMADTAIE